MKRLLVIFSSIFLVALMGLAPLAAAAAEKPAWQLEWEKTLAAARGEGKVVVYIVWGSDLQNALKKPMKEKFGIDVEYITGRGADTVNKLLTERRAGIYSSDLWLAGPGSMLASLKPVGALTSIRPLLLLPEVLDKKAYFGNEIPFVDKEMLIIPHAQAVGNSLAINTEIVKPGEIKGYADLLNPKWKGKIVINDPTIAGTAPEWFFATAMNIMSPDFHRQLVKQEPVVTRDLRQQVEWLAKGKYPIALSPYKGEVAEFQRLGAPIDWIRPVEGEFISPSGSLAYIDKAPHPNASKVFVNWLMSKEGLTVWSRTSLWMTARRDVPTDFLPAKSIRDPNQQYVNLCSEEMQLKLIAAMKLAKEIYGPLIQ